MEKKNMLLTGTAVALAAALSVGGGAYAYLQDNTDPVVNAFDTNKVTVDLAETTENVYDIIPGTEQAKDPKVTVNATVDSYVFVEVTDKTDGLVSYEIAEGWTKLDGFDNVYYREANAQAEAQVFDVLKDNKVAYSADLENSDMMSGGKLKEGLELSFEAAAIQKDGFETSLAAYWTVSSITTNAPADIKEALLAGNSVVLSDSITFDEQTQSLFISRSTKDPSVNILLDLNGKTVTGISENTIKVNRATITLDGNGTVVGGAGGSANTAVAAGTGAKVVINNGTYSVGADKNGNANSVVYVSSTGVVEINGGTFYNTDGNFVLNKQDGCKGSIIVKGGTFKDFDPSNNLSEGAATNFVAEGYTVQRKSEDGHTWYTVVPVSQ